MKTFVSSSKKPNISHFISGNFWYGFSVHLHVGVKKYRQLKNESGEEFSYSSYTHAPLLWRNKIYGLQGAQ